MPRHDYIMRSFRAATGCRGWRLSVARDSRKNGYGSFVETVSRVLGSFWVDS